MAVQYTEPETTGQTSELREDECAAQNRDGGIHPHDATINVVMDTIVSKFNWGNAISNSSYSQLLYLTIQEVEIPLVLQFDEPIILGRQAEVEAGEHALDLTVFGGNEKGVSRRHAAIQRMKNSVVLVDLGSSNNSYINGQKVSSQEPHILVEGDEIRLGNLVASISYGPVIR
jgi:hypothetical protein